MATSKLTEKASVETVKSAARFVITQLETVGSSQVESVRRAGMEATVTALKDAGVNDGCATDEDIGHKHVEFTVVSGEYIGSDNTKKTGQYFSRSTQIAVAKGDIIEFKATGYNNNVAMIALTDAEQTFYKMVVRSVDSTERTYTYTCLDSGYIIVSYENRHGCSLTIKSALSNAGLYKSVNNLYETGVYQLAVDSGIVISADDVAATVSQTGHYINNSGVNTSSGNFNIYSPISLQKGSVISFNAKGYTTNVAVLARINADATYTPLVVSEDSDEHGFTYFAVEDMNVCITSHISVVPRYSVFSSRIDANDISIQDLHKKKLNELSDDSCIAVHADNVQAALLESGCYIANDGSHKDGSGASNFRIYGVITLPKGSMLKFTATGYSANVAVLARVDTNVTYTPLIVSTDNVEHEFSYVALVETKVVISSLKTTTPSYSLYASRIDENASRIHDIDNNYVAFATIGVIGDSLASGASNYPGGAEDRKEYSWGKCIEREHGMSVSLFSSGGATTRSWLAQSYGLAALQAANALDCYIIGLGVNDAYSLGDAYLGSASDIHIENESENADTYYGNYSRIIAAIKAKSPRAKIFCITNPRGTSATGIAYNEAVEDIVGLYTNTYLVDLREDDFYTSPEFKSTWYSAHSTAVGYKLIAQNLYNHINEIIQVHVKEFLDIQWIVNDHA